MACNSCAKPFSLLRKEKGCPGCGFSYCSKCLDHKVFVKKLNAEAKVCIKCKRAAESTEPQKVEPPDAYYKRLRLMKSESLDHNVTTSSQVTQDQNTIDQQIQDRLQKLKERNKAATGTSSDEIAERLQKIKGEVPSTSDAELQARLANLRGVPISAVQSKPVLPAPDLRTEQEQADDLIKQYLEQTEMEGKYKDEFDSLLSDMDSRIKNLKGSNPGVPGVPEIGTKEEIVEPDDDESIRKIVEKIKSEASLGDEIPSPTNDELPFCEICNEDAKMRCLGCRYLFCKLCFMEHKDEDDGCNRYEAYSAPKGSY